MFLAGLKTRRGDRPRQEMATALADFVPKRLARTIAEMIGGSGTPCRFSRQASHQHRRGGE